jgi:hypothetical protein
MTDKQITVHKLFSLKAIRVSSFFFGIFGVTLMVVSNLKVFENLAPEKSLSPFLKKKYPKSYNTEMFKELWLYTIITSVIMFFFIFLLPNLPDYIFAGVAPAFGEFAYRKFLKKDQEKYLKETIKHSFGKIMWTGLKGVFLYFLLAFFLLLYLIIIDIQIPE